MYKYQQKATKEAKSVPPMRQTTSPQLENITDPLYREITQKIHSIDNPILPDGSISRTPLTGFTETLGPTRIDSASNEIIHFWENKLKQFIVDFIKERRENILGENDKSAL